MHPNGLIIDAPGHFANYALLSAPPIAAKTPVPKRIDRRDEMLPASNQGLSSECAAYSLAGILEAKKWRDTGVFKQIDPSPIYAEAKNRDGYAGAGTTLKAAMDAAIALGIMAKPTEIFAISDLLGFKRALHRYGFAHLAFNITDAWSEPSAAGWISDDASLPLIGGHAVAGCAYDSSNGQQWIGIQNSWSNSVGWHGFMRMSEVQFKRQFLYGVAWR